MSIFIKIAEVFIGLFKTGADTFVSWMANIIPLVFLLMIFMNTVVNLIGENNVNKFAQWASKYSIMRYMILPFIAAFMLGNPASFTLGKFLPEFYKPSYYAAIAQFCHTSNGIFPHINPGELFVYLGIASGIETLGLSTVPLAVRYMLVGLVLNAVGAYVTDFTTAYVCKKTGITLSKSLIEK
jgi:glucitol/sorbitol PTS system EIIC component